MAEDVPSSDFDSQHPPERPELSSEFFGESLLDAELSEADLPFLEERQAELLQSLQRPGLSDDEEVDIIETLHTLGIQIETIIAPPHPERPFQRIEKATEEELEADRQYLEELRTRFRRRKKGS